MVSQSVLLRGVNDDAATLEALMRAFVECRIKPYYLHHGDLAPGTAHLRTTLEQGQELMRRCAAGSPDCASRTTCSIFPAATARRRSGRIICRILFPGNVNLIPETRYRVVDYCGDVHLYPPKP
jgi:lysine 2,3-aminomutase